MQMPRWLFSDPRYADMSLDAKVAYTFLLNRFQLSRRNGWTSDQGEVFVIFPRKELARELHICEKRVTAAFQTLAERNLIWEKRCGRGDANQIYLAHVQPQDNPEYTSAPFIPKEHTDDSKIISSVREPELRLSLTRWRKCSRIMPECPHWSGISASCMTAGRTNTRRAGRLPGHGMTKEIPGRTGTDTPFHSPGGQAIVPERKFR